MFQYNALNITLAAYFTTGAAPGVSATLAAPTIWDAFLTTGAAP